MSNKLFSYLAKISYSVYMTHALIAVLFDILAKRFFSAYVKSYTEVGGIGGDVYIVIYLLFVILVSHITWRVVEGYGGRWLSRALKIRRRSKVAAKAAATA
jgi:peptidoglycan/LPS O-acetylase OafA/YrhL